MTRTLDPVVLLGGAEWGQVLASCTPRQVECLDLWRRHYGYRTIGAMLGLDPTTARGHVEAGLRHVGYSPGHFAALR